MAIVHRRIFFAKVGKAEELVQRFEKDNELLAKYGGANWNSRTLTDYWSGRSDRVVVEWRWKASTK